MAWTSLCPDGTKSVRFNTPLMAGNTAYTETTMNLDHYWNFSATLDGHHRFAQMTQSGTPAAPTNPTPATGIDLVYFCKSKTAVESPAQQDVQPFTISNPNAPLTQQVMQLLGIRAMGVFTVTGTTVTINYSHNLNTQANPSPGVQRVGTGVYRANFPTLPSANYAVLGGVIRNSSNAGDLAEFCMRAGTSLATVKTPTFFNFALVTTGGAPVAIDPLQCWFVAFGG